MSQPSLAETKILETKDEEILLRFLELGIFDHIIHFHLPPFSCSDDIWWYMPNCSFYVITGCYVPEPMFGKIVCFPWKWFHLSGKIWLAADGQQRRNIIYLLLQTGTLYAKTLYSHQVFKSFTQPARKMKFRRHMVHHLPSFQNNPSALEKVSWLTETQSVMSMSSSWWK